MTQEQERKLELLRNECSKISNSLIKELMVNENGEVKVKKPYDLQVICSLVKLEEKSNEYDKTYKEYKKIEEEEEQLRIKNAEKREQEIVNHRKINDFLYENIQFGFVHTAKLLSVLNAPK